MITQVNTYPDQTDYRVQFNITVKEQAILRQAWNDYKFYADNEKVNAIFYKRIETILKDKFMDFTPFWEKDSIFAQKLPRNHIRCERANSSIGLPPSKWERFKNFLSGKKTEVLITARVSVMHPESLITKREVKTVNQISVNAKREVVRNFTVIKGGKE